jgi:hypothetical protein
MANPKTLLEKIAQYQNDSFNIWLQKTNIAADEVGDLNVFISELLTVLQSSLAKVGTISGALNGVVLTGTTTQFMTDVSVGDVIKITHSSGNFERRIVSRTNNNSLTVDLPFPLTFSSATYENLKDLSLVSAINYIYGEYSRINLVKAIAMS